MKDVLDAVDHRRPVRAFDDVDDAFEPQEIGTAMRGQRLEQQGQCHRADRRISHNGVGLDVERVRAVGMIVRCFAQPRLNIERLGERIVRSGIEQVLRIDPAVVGTQHRGRVELGEAMDELWRRGAGKIRFGQHHAVGHRHLLDRDRLAVERGGAVHGIDCRHDAAQHHAAGDRRIGHQRL